MAPSQARGYLRGMAWYDAILIGEGIKPERMIHFEAENDAAAIAHADQRWISAEWTTTATAYRLRKVATDTVIHSRERRRNA